MMPFWKMHGAGNDFILFDDRGLTFPADDPAWIESVCQRRTGIGCEGILLLQPSDKAHFRMRFFNPDGRPAEMCGNGARCAARLANQLGIADNPMRIATDAGLLSATVTAGGVQLSLPDPTDLRPYFDLEVDGNTLSAGSANTGVPHVVLEMQDLDEAPVIALGAAIRHHASFIPDGTNVNFIQRLDEHTLRIRTYERGVEAESGACGTGAAAAAIVMALRGRAQAPITLTALSGDHLTIGFDLQEDTVINLTLSGPTAHVYRGELALPGEA